MSNERTAKWNGFELARDEITLGLAGGAECGAEPEPEPESGSSNGRGKGCAFADCDRVRAVAAPRRGLCDVPP